MPFNTAKNTIRRPAVAGTFYPKNPDELKATVRHYLNEADKYFELAQRAPKAIIAPHAGYKYSGLTAAAVYNRLYPARKIIKRIIILGPCHRVAINGVALPSAKIFQTPIGDISVDTKTTDSIRNLDYVNIFNPTHIDDHSIETHLPFLQTVIKEFKIVPLIIGEVSADKIAGLLEILWGGPETLILISSDLSHYLEYTQAKITDNQTCKVIEQMNYKALEKNQACGRHSINGLLMLAKRKGLSVTTADIRNSGDTAGRKDSVVGYGSWYFEESHTQNKNINDNFFPLPKDILTEYGDTLLRFVADIIFSQVLKPKSKITIPPELENLSNLTGASFITLTKQGKLRGCIGSIQASKSLIRDIADNAYKAAFKDPRFTPLTLTEIHSGKIELTISILGSQTQIYFSTESELIEQLKSGVDGVILSEGTKNRSTFLPSVWEQIPNPKIFIGALKRKAGLSEDYWSEKIKVWRFSASSRSSIDLPRDDPLWPT
jgi:hypothetical protein